MAPVPLEPEVKYTGAALVALHAFSVIYFIQRVCSSLNRSFNSLSPSQDVRLRLDRRRKLVPIFGGLAVISLIIACYTALAYASLSYDVWADQRGLGVSQSNIEGGFATNSSATQDEPHAYHLVLDRVRWLADTPIYQDAFEIIAEKARRFWWGQQLDLSLVPWSVLLATEGTRRGISNLFAFQCLAHLVSLSFAQNLFFVALLLTPVPLSEDTRPPSRLVRVRDAIFPPKPRDWVLKPGFLLLSVLASYATISIVPYAAETPSFNRVVGASRALTFAPLALQIIAPTSWGTVETDRRTDAAFVDLFRFMAVMSIFLHGMSTFSGLRYAIPHAHYHRHSRLLPWDIEERSRWERTTTAVGKLLGATRDHPVVSAVGYDVMLSAVSVGTWAAVRSRGAGDILASVVPLYHKHDSVSTPDKPDKIENDNDREDVPEDSAAEIVRRRARRIRKSKEDEDHREPAPPRRRGRPRKIRQDPEEEPGDNTFKPTQEEGSARGDEVPAQELDLEAAGLAWGLMSVGGLALGSAGVFGGECLAR